VGIIMAILGSLGGLGSLIKGILDPVSKITGQIADVKINAQNATTEQAKVEAQEHVSALQAQRDVMIAESGHPLNTIARFLLVAPVTAFLWKVIVWDKALGQWTAGRTDDLTANEWWVVFSVVGFYTLTTIVKTAKR
jgi:Holin of 3TMs, for gene-transfer release